MSTKYVLALDQGTTSSRAILFDSEQNIIAVAAAGVCSRSTRSRAGWSTTPWRSGPPSTAVMNEVVAQSGVDVRGHCRHRHHQPARDHHPVG